MKIDGACARPSHDHSQSRRREGPPPTFAADEEQERTVGLLLLGKGAVLAHWFDCPLAAGMDESRQRLHYLPSTNSRYRNARNGALAGDHVDAIACASKR
jgi:hypothetical protein